MSAGPILVLDRALLKGLSYAWEGRVRLYPWQSGDTPPAPFRNLQHGIATVPRERTALFPLSVLQRHARVSCGTACAAMPLLGISDFPARWKLLASGYSFSGTWRVPKHLYTLSLVGDNNQPFPAYGISMVLFQAVSSA